MFPRAPLPERIGPYTVLRRLPSTGGADRYLGREDGPRGFTRMVELKLAPAESDPEVAAELAHEASVVSRLNHPYIARMYHFFEHEGRLVLVLERVEGTTLGRILAAGRRRRQRLPDEAVYYVAHRLVGAIAHAHSMTDEDGQRTPVVHRSISPAALLVGWGGEVRLSGFGLAKIMGRSPDTAVGLVKGTVGYMAPEQLRGERITERTDLYQAGLVIWEMLSGNPPAASNAPQKTRQAELVMMMSGPELASVSTLRPSVPREIAAVIDAMVEPSVEKRKISAAEVERWLAKTVDVEGGKEGLRERAIALRGQEVRDSVSGAEPMRMTPTQARRVTRGRGEDSNPSVSVRRPGRITGESSALTPLPDPAQLAASGPPPAPSDPNLASPIEARLTPPSPAVHAPPPPPPSPMARVTLPDADHSTPATNIPVEGERAADTLMLRRPRRAAIGLGLAGGALLLVGGAITVRSLSSPSVSPQSSAPSASSAPVPPVSTTPPVEPPPPPPPTGPVVPSLGPRQGALIVKSSSPGHVYINGAMSGETGQVLVVTCGPRFVRVGAPSPVGGRILWLGRGQSVKVPCGVLTEVEFRTR